MNAITDKEFQQIVGFIKANYGINLKEKRALLTGRLTNVLQQKGYESFTDFYNDLVAHKSSEAITALVNRITTNHTFFMREKEHFTYFQNTVMPYLENKVLDKDLRVWCAACSSGEESYTLAMIIQEHFSKNKLFWDSKVLATDISEKVLAEAKNGIYAAERIEPLPTAWKMNYFKKYDNDNYIITDKLKNEVIYRKFNLMDKTFPFKRKFHVIFCRNVMIYFDYETKMELIKKFYDLLEIGGYLFIGHSEALARYETDFKYIMPAVYRKA
ncbi:MAG: chemotaxis protein CheR [Clostridiales bacterium GWF2_38_85]|nr:MAG: chemotaxis protein CheR [Clostridiales bacterium GWF2_38_85]HBL83445.1 chemotaxis protein CheR [Clostridiales bacterium]